MKVTEKAPQHPRDGLKSKNKIYDAIQKSFPLDKDELYFENKPGLLRDPDQKEKDKLFMSILNAYRKQLGPDLKVKILNLER